MGLFNFIGDVGKKIFGDNTDDTQKKQHIHDEINALDLPAHVSIAVEGSKVIIEGNATDQATKEKVILAVGNIEGVDSVEDKIILPEETDASQAQFVTVQSGDTLWKISQSVYGDGSQYPIIFEANKPMLKSADAIFVGQTLRIPVLKVA